MWSRCILESSYQIWARVGVWVIMKMLEIEMEHTLHPTKVVQSGTIFQVWTLRMTSAGEWMLPAESQMRTDKCYRLCLTKRQSPSDNSRQKNNVKNITVLVFSPYVIYSVIYFRLKALLNVLNEIWCKHMFLFHVSIRGCFNLAILYYAITVYLWNLFR